MTAPSTASTAAARPGDVDATAVTAVGTADAAERSRIRAMLLSSGRIARRAPWWHVIGAAALVTFGVWQLHGSPWTNVASASSVLRLGAIGLAASVAFTFDDPTEPTLTGTPVGVWARRTMKLVPMLVVLTVAWLGLLAFAEAAPPLNTSQPVFDETGVVSWGSPIPKPESGWWLPIGALSIQLAAFTALVLAGAAWGSKLAADRSGGIAGVGLMLVGLLVAAIVQQRWPMYVDPGAEPEIWRAAHIRWAWVGGVAFTIALLGNRDPGRHSRLRRRRTSAPTTAAPTTLQEG